LYIACISSIGDYGIPVWWNRTNKKTLLKGYNLLQSSALKLILGAFANSPTRAMEIEAGLPPVEVRFEKICNSYALRVLKFNKYHPVKQCYALEIQDELVGSDSSSYSNNSTIKYIQSPQIQLKKLLARLQTFHQDWRIERTSIKWAKPWDKELAATFIISLSTTEKASEEHISFVSSLQPKVEKG
jgi:hypothetical protein